jgi:hypothetical protein
MNETDRGVIVREREVLNFPTLEVATEVATEVKTEYLPVLYVAPVEVVIETTTIPEPVLPVDDFVPADVEQRLLYHWLRFGPPWAPDIVMQAPPPVPDDTPVVNPLYFPRKRVIGHFDDGVTRAIRRKE